MIKTVWHQMVSIAWHVLLKSLLMKTRSWNDIDRMTRVAEKFADEDKKLKWYRSHDTWCRKVCWWRQEVEGKSWIIFFLSCNYQLSLIQSCLTPDDVDRMIRVAEKFTDKGRKLKERIESLSCFTIAKFPWFTNHHNPSQPRSRTSGSIVPNFKILLRRWFNLVLITELILDYSTRRGTYSSDLFFYKFRFPEADSSLGSAIVVGTPGKWKEKNYLFYIVNFKKNGGWECVPSLLGSASVKINWEFIYFFFFELYCD